MYCKIVPAHKNGFFIVFADNICDLGDKNYYHIPEKITNIYYCINYEEAAQVLGNN